jgi:hypothetical protein
MADTNWQPVDERACEGACLWLDGATAARPIGQIDALGREVLSMEDPLGGVDR